MLPTVFFVGPYFDVLLISTMHHIDPFNSFHNSFFMSSIKHALWHQQLNGFCFHCLGLEFSETKFQ